MPALGSFVAALRKIDCAEQFDRDGIDGEGHDEQRDPAVGEHGARQNDGEQGPLPAEQADDAQRDHLGGAGV